MDKTPTPTPRPEFHRNSVEINPGEFCDYGKIAYIRVSEPSPGPNSKLNQWKVLVLDQSQASYFWFCKNQEEAIEVAREIERKRQEWFKENGLIPLP